MSQRRRWPRSSTGREKWVTNLNALSWIDEERARRALVLERTATEHNGRLRNRMHTASTIDRIRHLSYLGCLLETLRKSSVTFTEWFGSTGYEQIALAIPLIALVASQAGWHSRTRSDKCLVVQPTYTVPQEQMNKHTQEEAAQSEISSYNRKQKTDLDVKKLELCAGLTN